MRASRVAFVVLIAVFAAHAFYVYPSESGVAHLTGRTLGIIAILGVIAAIISKLTKRPMRGDVVLGLAAIVLVTSSSGEIFATYDVRRFRPYVPFQCEATRPRCVDEGCADGPGRASHEEGES
jgi:hypothetical protein